MTTPTTHFCRHQRCAEGKIRELRAGKHLSRRTLGEWVGATCAYISKHENGEFDFGNFFSAALIGSHAAALDSDEEELLLLGEKIPESIRRRVFKPPDAFRLFSRLDHKRLNQALVMLEAE